jgi:hypothetical protein
VVAGTTKKGLYCCDRGWSSVRVRAHAVVPVAFWLV